MAPVPHGVLVIDKPEGPTSHDVVARVRRAFRTREVGHAGTLDPMATGVLVVAIGEATKLLAWLTDHDKAYEATVTLGIETDTLDAVGREVSRAPLEPALLDALATSASDNVHPLIAAALASERTRTTQIPPAYSAIRTKGVRAYTRARRGEHEQLAARAVAVRALRLTGCSREPPSLSVSVEVAKGYYVRALGRDLAEALGTAGHLTALRRTRSGCFSIEQATPLDAPPASLAQHLEPLVSVAARALPIAHLTETGRIDARHGRLVHAGDITTGARGPAAWFAQDGTLVAIGETDDTGAGRVKRGFLV